MKRMRLGPGCLPRPRLRLAGQRAVDIGDVGRTPTLAQAIDVCFHEPVES